MLFTIINDFIITYFYTKSTPFGINKADIVIISILMPIPQNPRRMNYHHDPDFDEEDLPTVIGIMIGILLLWWGVVHLIDKFTFDALPWWAEPFTILPMFGYIVMLEKYETANPLHWWPMLWGYKVPLANEDEIVLYPLDRDALVKQWGGRGNVYFIDHKNIKFRKKKDAVNYCLFNL